MYIRKLVVTGKLWKEKKVIKSVKTKYSFHLVNSIALNLRNDLFDIKALHGTLKDNTLKLIHFFALNLKNYI